MAIIDPFRDALHDLKQAYDEKVKVGKIGKKTFFRVKVEVGEEDRCDFTATLVGPRGGRIRGVRPISGRFLVTGSGPANGRDTVFYYRFQDGRFTPEE